MLVLGKLSFLIGRCPMQRDLIGRFIALWATFLSLWQQLFCPNFHIFRQFVKGVQLLIFLVNLHWRNPYNSEKDVQFWATFIDIWRLFCYRAGPMFKLECEDNSTKLCLFSIFCSVSHFNDKFKRQKVSAIKLTKQMASHRDRTNNWRHQWSNLSKINFINYDSGVVI